MPRSMQYCRRICSRVDGRLVGRDGVTGVLTVARVGVGALRSGVMVVDVRVGRGVGRLAGRDVAAFSGTTVVSGGVCCTTGGVELGGGPADGVSATNVTAAGSSDPPPNRPITDTAQMFTARKTSSDAAPAYAARRDGAPYRPIGPSTALPLPSRQKCQPGGAGGQDGSGRQLSGGIQLRRGGIGQFGGATNRFKRTPPLHRHDPRTHANDTDPTRATCSFTTKCVSTGFSIDRRASHADWQMQS